jgi:hypothetical protein
VRSRLKPSELLERFLRPGSTFQKRDHRTEPEAQPEAGGGKSFWLPHGFPRRHSGGHGRFRRGFGRICIENGRIRSEIGQIRTTFGRIRYGSGAE